MIYGCGRSGPRYRPFLNGHNLGIGRNVLGCDVIPVDLSVIKRIDQGEQA